MKKKLLFQFTNFGKPTIAVYDGNFDNRGELLWPPVQRRDARHRAGQGSAQAHLRTRGPPGEPPTIVEESTTTTWRSPAPRPRTRAREIGKRIRYDGDEVTVTDVDWAEVEHLTATDIDYDTGRTNGWPERCVAPPIRAVTNSARRRIY